MTQEIKFSEAVKAMPDSYRTLPLGKYLDLCDALTEPDGMARTAKVVAVLSGVPEDELMKLPVTLFGMMVSRTKFLGEEPPEADPTRVPSSYSLGGMTLRVQAGLADITTAQYVDFQTFTKADPSLRSLPSLLSVVLVPEGHRYNEGYDPAEVAGAVREGLSVTEAQDLAAFFLRKFARSIRVMLTFSAVSVRMRLRGTERRKALETLRKAREGLASLTGGAGSPAWTRFPRPSGALGRRSGR